MGEGKGGAGGRDRRCVLKSGMPRPPRIPEYTEEFILVLNALGYY